MNTAFALILMVALGSRESAMTTVNYFRSVEDCEVIGKEMKEHIDKNYNTYKVTFKCVKVQAP